MRQPPAVRYTRSTALDTLAPALRPRHPKTEVMQTQWLTPKNLKPESSDCERQDPGTSQLVVVPCSGGRPTWATTR